MFHLTFHKLITKNIFSAWIRYFVRIAIAFFFIPYITNILGQERYGIWVILFQTIAYFSLFDIGIEQALIRFISRFHVENNYIKINKYLSTATAYYFITALLITALGYLTSTFLFQILKVENQTLIQEGSQALFVAFIYLASRFILLPINTVPAGCQRHDISNFFLMSEEILRVLGLVWVLSNHGSMVALASVILLISLTRQVAIVIFVRFVYSKIKINFKSIEKETAKELFGYSRIVFGISIAQMILFNSDGLLLGYFGSVAATGVYAPASQLMLYIRNLFNVISPIITTSISGIDKDENNEKIKEIFNNTFKYAVYLTVLISTIIFFWSDSFVSLWLSESFSETANIMIYLAIGTAVFTPHIISNGILYGLSKHKFILYIFILEVIIKLAIAPWLINEYNAVGMALAVSMPQVILYLLVFPFFLSKAISLNTFRIYSSFTTGFLPAFTIVYICSFLFKANSDETTWLSFLIEISITLAIGVLGILTISNSSERAYLKSLFSRK